MTRGEIDLVDAFISPAFVLSAAAEAGIVGLVLFGFDFTTALLTLGSGAAAVEISAAKLISILAVIAVIVTNKPDLDAMGAMQTWLTIATIGLILAPPFSPLLEGIIVGNALAGIVALVIQSGGFYTLGYLG